jgi:hypothetical protein
LIKISEKNKKYFEQIAKSYGCKLGWESWDSFYAARYYRPNREIWINLYHIGSLHEMICGFFHELGHHECSMNNKYVYYHSVNDVNPWYMLHYGLRAERYVDKVGARIMKEYLPKLTFYSGYHKDRPNSYYRKVMQHEED